MGRQKKGGKGKKKKKGRKAKNKKPDGAAGNAFGGGPGGKRKGKGGKSTAALDVPLGLGALAGSPGGGGDDDGWGLADRLFQDTQEAIRRHTALWAEVRQTVGRRDEWHARFLDVEKQSQDVLDLESQARMFGGGLSKTKSLDAARRCHALEKRYTMCRRKLTELNNKMLALTKEILALEARYPIKGEERQKEIGAAMRRAVETNNPDAVLRLLNAPPPSTAASNAANAQAARRAEAAAAATVAAGGGGGMAAVAALAAGTGQSVTLSAEIDRPAPPKTGAPPAAIPEGKVAATTALSDAPIAHGLAVRRVMQERLDALVRAGYPNPQPPAAAAAAAAAAASGRARARADPRRLLLCADPQRR